MTIQRVVARLKVTAGTITSNEDLKKYLEDQFEATPKTLVNMVNFISRNFPKVTKIETHHPNGLYEIKGINDRLERLNSTVVERNSRDGNLYMAKDGTKEVYIFGDADEPSRGGPSRDDDAFSKSRYSIIAVLTVA